MLILGARTLHGYPSRILVDRLRAARPLIDAAPGPVVVSGDGEAASMARWLVEHGVSEARIVKEPRARSTNENLENAAALFPDVARWTVVTSDFHVWRTRLWAWHLGIPVRVVGAPTQRRDLLVAGLREALALPHSALRILWRRVVGSRPRVTP
ncbi:MAG: YdcF family protein [Corynebacterium sp.]|uniref:YdcF family protein n=1 Tax=Corynebacterium sp. TaxID=1720 RepID=UPI0026E00A44|nr:YdcF family protein [Corynebacterium sp.]MDO5670140.1 YdcF family protein [Corynebacterium sp.]